METCHPFDDDMFFNARASDAPPVSAVSVRWVTGRPFLMSTGEWYRGDWIYAPATLANGGPDAVSCE